MLDLGEARSDEKLLPSRPIAITTVPFAAPAFLVFAARIGTKEDTVGLQHCPKLFQNSRQLLAWHMEQRCVGEDAIKKFRRQVELQKILAPNFAAAVSTRQFDEARRAVKTDRLMAQFAEYLQISPGTAAKVEYAKGSRAAKVS